MRQEPPEIHQRNVPHSLGEAGDRTEGQLGQTLEDKFRKKWWLGGRLKRCLLRDTDVTGRGEAGGGRSRL